MSPHCVADLLGEPTIAPVRNTFLHFGDLEAPALRRSMTAPLQGWRTEEVEAETEAETEEWHREDEEAQPCVGRHTTRDSFDSPGTLLPLEEMVVDRRWIQPRRFFGSLPPVSAGQQEEEVEPHGVDEVHEPQPQPPLERVVTRDPFESPCQALSGIFAFASDSGFVRGTEVGAVPLGVPRALVRVTSPVATEGGFEATSIAGSSEGSQLSPERATASASSGVRAAGWCEASGKRGSQRTTVILRNMPNSYTRASLLKLLNAEGFAGKYDFVYLPIDFRTHSALGYAFVNLTSPDAAERVHQRLNGFTKWPFPSSKACSVSWSHPHQGLESHIARYRNSPLMHDVVPDHYRPALFSEGQRIPFAPPTKKIKFPRKGTERMLVGVGAKGGS
jgi:hypothetical protein